jgi:hypothetical protein
MRDSCGHVSFQKRLLLRAWRGSFHECRRFSNRLL